MVLNDHSNGPLLFTSYWPLEWDFLSTLPICLFFIYISKLIDNHAIQDLFIATVGYLCLFTFLFSLMTTRALIHTRLDTSGLDWTDHLHCMLRPSPLTLQDLQYLKLSYCASPSQTLKGKRLSWYFGGLLMPPNYSRNRSTSVYLKDFYVMFRPPRWLCD